MLWPMYIRLSSRSGWRKLPWQISMFTGEFKEWHYRSKSSPPRKVIKILFMKEKKALAIHSIRLIHLRPGSYKLTRNRFWHRPKVVWFNPVILELKSCVVIKSGKFSISFQHTFSIVWHRSSYLDLFFQSYIVVESDLVTKMIRTLSCLSSSRSTAGYSGRMYHMNFLLKLTLKVNN